MSPDEKIIGSKIYAHLHEQGCKDSYAKAMELILMDKIVDFLKIVADNSDNILKILEEADEARK